MWMKGNFLGQVLLQLLKVFTYHVFTFFPSRILSETFGTPMSREHRRSGPERVKMIFQQSHCSHLLHLSAPVTGGEEGSNPKWI